MDSLFPLWGRPQFASGQQLIAPSEINRKDKYVDIIQGDRSACLTKHRRECLPQTESTLDRCGMLHDCATCQILGDCEKEFAERGIATRAEHKLGYAPVAGGAGGDRRK